ncbi:MAG TPA: DUF2442 domain-containing protein [Longimicrobiaceae bacterium]|jgi:hypothetical protein
MFLHVVRVDPLPHHRIRVEFSDGVVKEVDLAGELHGEVFEPLRDAALFSRAAINPETGTVEWPNGADFAPEFLHDLGTEVQRVA